ncbi:MAG: DUF1080 domain-containing protein [Planctomycetia bacterium]
MPPTRTLIVVLLLSALPGPASGHDASADEQPLAPIFNGRDFTGWKREEGPFWRVEDGVLVGENDAAMRGSMLYTDRDYGDFVVELEFRAAGEVDSGIMVRKPELQVQIGVSRSLKRDMTCSFYTGHYPEEGRATRAPELLQPGGWNRVRLEARGDTFTVWLNGEQVSRYTGETSAHPAPIGLQIHRGLPMKIEFRNIRVGVPREPPQASTEPPR